MGGFAEGWEHFDNKLVRTGLPSNANSFINTEQEDEFATLQERGGEIRENREARAEPADAKR